MAQGGECSSLPEGAPIDAGVFAGLRQLGDAAPPGFVRDLFAVFVSSTGAKIPLMREAAARQDLATLALLAHGLKSSAANLGALRLADLFRDLEMQARTNSLADFETQFVRLQAEFAQVEAFARSLVENPAAKG